MSDTVELVAPPDTAAIETREAGIVEAANSLVVDSNDSIMACEHLVGDIDTAIKAVKAELNSGIEKANAAHKHLTGQRKKYLDPLEEAKRIGKGKGAKYRRQLEDERRAEEDRRRAAALKEEQERKLAEAVQLVDAGHAEAADEVLEQPTVTPPVVVPPTAPPKPAGMYRENWTARVDKPGDVPREWCIPDQVALNAHARTLKGAAVGTVAGVTFYNASGL